MSWANKMTRIVVSTNKLANVVPRSRLKLHQRPCASLVARQRQLSTASSAAIQPVNDHGNDKEIDHHIDYYDDILTDTSPSSSSSFVGSRPSTCENSGHGVTLNPRRAEMDDYLLAVEMGKSIPKSSSPIKRNPRLPSMMDPSAYPPLTKTTISSANPTTPWPTNSGPSRLPSPSSPSLKGKEKAHTSPAPSSPCSSNSSSSYPSNTGPRRNAVGVQLLSPSLHSQLFPGPSLPSPPPGLLDLSLRHLSHHGLSPSGAATLPEISFSLPPLQGSNIREHLHAIGHHTAEPYLTMAKNLADAQLPPMPDQWVTTEPGWHRYDPQEGNVVPVDHVLEDIVSFDVETLHKISPYPVMAIAASPKAWYSWLSPSLFETPPSSPTTTKPRWDTRTQDHLPHDLIPLFDGKRPTIAIGHNVGYDRARVLEEYSLDRTPTRWLDTLSLHVATRGITSVQRSAWMLHRKRKQINVSQAEETIAFLREMQEQADRDADIMLKQSLADISEDSPFNSDQLGMSGSEAAQKRWEDTTSINSLAEVANLHCGIKMDKTTRDRFSDDSITHASQLKHELPDLLNYCATDVKITHDVFKVVLPLFLASCPHPATFAGVLAMGNAFLPVDQNWEKYLRDAEGKYQELSEGVKKALRLLAEKLRRQGPKEDDPWSSQLDWTPKPARWADSPEYDEQVNKSATITPIQDQSEKATIASSSSDTSNDKEINPHTPPTPSSLMPRWYEPIATNPQVFLDVRYQRNIIPLILRMSYKGYPVVHLSEHFWCFKVPQSAISDFIPDHGLPVEPGPKDCHLESTFENFAFFRISSPGENRRAKLVGGGHLIKKDVKDGLLTSPYPDVLKKTLVSDLTEVADELAACAKDLKDIGRNDDWGMQLDWTESTPTGTLTSGSTIPAPRSTRLRFTNGSWPKWYWDLTAPASNKKVPFGELDLTVRKSVAPLLLRLQWNGHPLFLSRQHKWLYRVPKTRVKSISTKSDDNSEADVKMNTAVKPVSAVVDLEKSVEFSPMKGDEKFAADSEHFYFKLPHKDGEDSNVGNPLTKSFLGALESGELASAVSNDGDTASAEAASAATQMNAQCSYWIGARERIMDQMVVWRDESHGMILPKVITMGTVTRRAVESTWLTASNAKKNRVGSELKAMVRAPKGYAIVGADVDSEELWISSVMGDSQFGVHGATAIGWMTLEGTKSAGTDLHSKTASILKISRDAAKVFNYSRIYGAGQPHAVQLLMQGDSTLSKSDAEKLARSLYEATKGTKTRRPGKEPRSGRDHLWHGGSESYLFNTLESIALLDRPTTPALGCGVTRALRKDYLDNVSSYLPSRINWVVQSSGVDYLHLLIASMEYLLSRYDIKARYLISVHDEVRYLASEKDKYRTALALQIANAWTRALFCYNLGMDDVPQGVLFFSAVDIDHVLRKETDMPCVTPSHPSPIAPGESLDIHKLLEKTGGGDLGPCQGEPLVKPNEEVPAPVKIFADIRSPEHLQFLQVQADSNRLATRNWLKAQGRTPTSSNTTRKNSNMIEGIDDWVEVMSPRSRGKAQGNGKPKAFQGKFVDEPEVGDAWDDVDLGTVVWQNGGERRGDVNRGGIRAAWKERKRAFPIRPKS